MAKKVRWGVIGCGGIASRRTIPEFMKMASKAELISVMDISAERAEAVAKQFGIAHFCTDEKEVLANKEIDAVYIATPSNKHAEQTILAAKAGKNVLCEKPMALSVDEVDRMTAAVKNAGVKFMLGFCMRNNVYNKKARELVQSGKLGQIVMGRAELTCWYPPIPGAWRQDFNISKGGSFVDMGTHCVDILEWIMGSKIVEVTGFQDQLTHKYATKVEDSSTILAKFANGAHGIIDNYFNLPDAAAQNSLELHGTKGSIVAHGTIGQDPTGHMFSILQPQETGYDANQVRNNPVAKEEYHFEGIGLYGQMIDIFSECILNHTEPPVPLAEGRHSMRVVEAVAKATAERRVVRVED